MRLADDVVIITDQATAILTLLTQASTLNKSIEDIEDEIRASEVKRDQLMTMKRALENEARKIHNARWE